MSYNPRHLRTLAAVLAVPLPALVAYADVLPANPAPTNANDHLFTYHQPNVLGTSLDMKLVAASQAEADPCEQTILQEVERLRRILSTYDPESEISKLQANLSAEPIGVSEELHTVLLDYQLWRTKSGGAYSAQLADLSDFWAAAQKKGAMPTDAELTPFLTKIRQSAYVTPLSGNQVILKVRQPLNIDSLGKGFIVQKAAAVARLKHPTVTGILLNIGGDITALGYSSGPAVKPPVPWAITIADPQHAADNAPGLATIHLNNKAVATSGSYERFFTFGDKKLSHILNPLTGRPSANGVLQATVIAGDNATANALATLLCVLPDEEGIKLVERTAGAAGMLVLSDGKQIRSKGFGIYEEAAAIAVVKPEAPTVKPAAPAPDPAKPVVDGAWPTGYALGVDLTVLPSQHNQSYIPYICVWIEDNHGKPVKVLAGWVGDKKYMPAMMGFQAVLKASADFAGTTRATRRAGEYTFVWDGTNAANAPVPQGSYNLCVEVGYEHAGHQLQKLPVTCGTTKVNATLPGTPHWNPSPVIYGPNK